MAEITIDHLDREILRALEEDSRISLVQLSDRIGLSATPCKRRLARLQDSGLISQYSIALDRKVAGYGITAYVSVELERTDATRIAEFQRQVSLFDEVVTGTLMTGAQDFLLEVAVESLEEFDMFLQSKLMRIPGLQNVKSRFALQKFVNRNRVP